MTAEDAAGNISAPSGESSAVVTGDISPPSQPTNLVATGSLSSVAVSWSASSDNVAVVRYNLHRSTTNGFTPSAANRIAQPTGTSFTDSPLSPATYYYVVTAEDAAGNVSAASAQATAVVTGDITAPTAPGSPAAVGGTSSVALTWTASTDNVGVLRYNVHRSTTNGFTPSAANRIAQPTGLSYTDSPLAPATYYYRVTAEDAAGNISAASAQVSAVVSAQAPGLVAAYGFDEGSGATALDSSGNNNNGTITNATWTASGKFGSALNFNGSNAWVTVPNVDQPEPDRRRDDGGLGQSRPPSARPGGRSCSRSRPGTSPTGCTRTRARRGRTRRCSWRDRSQRQRDGAGCREHVDAPGRDL